MPKSLPVFGPENENESSRALAVFGPPEAAASDSIPIWTPERHEGHEAVSLFTPPEHANDSRNIPVFSLPAGFDPASAPACIPSVFGPYDPSAPTPQWTYSVTAAAEPPKLQGQRQIDKIIRKFLERIKAKDIRYRRIGHTTYTWLHEQDPEPGDTGSDVRWEIKVTGLQLNMGIYDIKPFFMVVSTPISVEKLIEVRKKILEEMKTDAGD